jgi:uncharacterized membrane protein HdeD (DUF308 family)
MAAGVLKIIEAVRLRKDISGEFCLILSGIPPVVFAFIVILRPAAGALALIWVIGWYAVFMGATLV